MWEQNSQLQGTGGGRRRTNGWQAPRHKGHSSTPRNKWNLGWKGNKWCWRESRFKPEPNISIGGDGITREKRKKLRYMLVSEEPNYTRSPHVSSWARAYSTGAGPGGGGSRSLRVLLCNFLSNVTLTQNQCLTSTSFKTGPSYSTSIIQTTVLLKWHPLICLFWGHLFPEHWLVSALWSSHGRRDDGNIWRVITTHRGKQMKQHSKTVPLVFSPRVTKVCANCQIPSFNTAVFKLCSVTHSREGGGGWQLPPEGRDSLTGRIRSDFFNSSA